MMEKRGRSPSLRRKNSIEQQSRSPDLYSVLEQKKLLTSAELKKVPIYSKHTVSSILYAQNVKRPHSFDKTKSPRPSVDKPIALSKVMPTKTKSNEDNLSSSYTKISSPKPEVTKKPHPHFQSRNYVNVMENNVKSQKQEKQPTKGLGSMTVDAEKKLRFHDDLLSPKDDHNLTTYEECDKITPSESNDILIVEDLNNQHLVEELHGEMESQKGDKILQCELLVPICLEGDADMPQSNTRSLDNVMVAESVNNEHLNDHNDKTNQQDQACETFDIGGDHLTRPNVDKENQKAENEQVAQEVDIGSKVVEDEGRKRKEPEVKEGGDEAPNKEDLILKMVTAYQQVVAHGKKDIATYNSVTEEMISKLREQRSNKVKALVGAFESVISHEYDVLPKRLLHINNN